MKRIESGQGATDLGSVGTGYPAPTVGITEVVQEIDNLRAFVSEMRTWAEKHPDSLRFAQVLGILEKYGL